jgi:glycosyltransferase involved in cell wall biosynthesis
MGQGKMLKSFVVVIPSFNNALWCRRNLESVLNQAYPLFRVIYVDDASTDETPDLVAAYLAESATADRVTFHRATRTRSSCLWMVMIFSLTLRY